MSSKNTDIDSRFRGNDSVESLKRKAVTFRRAILETLETAGSGHSGGSLSAVEIFLTLYGYQINYKPNDPR